MENEHALLVFTGSLPYVSASWYSNPYIGSTWNYMSVHAIGEIRFMSDSGIDRIHENCPKFEKGNTWHLLLSTTICRIPSE